MINNLLYYGFHSFVNQIRKLCKTWFLVFIIACMLLGGIIGFTASKLDESISTKEEITETIEEGTYSFIDKQNEKAVFEVIAGGLFVAIFVISILSANEKGINLFQPADVNLLFTSPMSPQSVLMFRVLCQMGLYVFFALYFMIEIPALKSMFEITSLQAAMVVLGYVIALATGTFVSIYISLLSTKFPKVKETSKYLILGLLGITALGFVLYWKGSDKAILDAIIDFFNSKFIIFIPIIGWLKGIIVYAIENKLVISVLFIILIICFNILLFYLIKNIKVDYYEEAMIKSEEIAELSAKVKEKGAIYAKGKKSGRQIEKEENITRNKLSYGSGALMFFIRPLYNRFRFAKFHVITKTLVTYLFVAIISALIAFKAEARLLYIPAGALCVFVFFRTMGNPLREDIENLYFVMSPLSGWSKLMCSVLAGSVNCLLDVLPGLIIAGIILRSSVLEILGCLGFIVALDFFSTSVGSFANLSLPQNVGSTVKQVLQIMFIYFGLLPDILIIVFGIIGKHELASVILLTALVNIVIGFVFIALAVPLIEPRAGIKEFAGNPCVNLKEATKSFSSVGFMATVTYVIAIAAQIGIIKLFQTVISGLKIEGVMLYLLNLIPLYSIAMPIGYLLVKNKEKRVLDKEPMTIKRLLKFIPVMFFFAMVGNLIGTLLSTFFSILSNQEYINPVNSILENQNVFVQILFVALIGPFFEELFFRKISIDHLNIYGEKLAIVVSAIVFGLFHGNITQGIYASLLGLILGYVYTRTGSLKYSFFLHAFLNFTNGILPSFLLSNVNYEALNTVNGVEDLMLSNSIVPLEALGIFYIVEVALAIVGLIIVCRERQNLIFKKAEKEIIKEKRFVVGFINPGIICFIVLMIFLIINDYIGLITITL